MPRVNSAPACPNVLQLVEWFECHTCYSLILEHPHIPCQDLQSFCEENGCLDESFAKKGLVQLITVLKHRESHRVLHRDIKPESLLISTASHDIKLLDFGCGDVLKDSAFTSFAWMFLVFLGLSGTLEYVLSEWFQQHCYHAGPATVWSAGMTLYNILCRCFPFTAAWRVSSKIKPHFSRELYTGKRYFFFFSFVFLKTVLCVTECRQLISWCLSAAAADHPSSDDSLAIPGKTEQVASDITLI
ncbi:hypothetical protein ABG768_007973 [Culter alburnus]|uniref:non-specific serine/threonine protein kinase n=1 Tax=Culter alburnus TaxID=194366 RepID=A0AAW1ZMP7_CULAL